MNRHTIRIKLLTTILGGAMVMGTSITTMAQGVQPVQLKQV